MMDLDQYLRCGLHEEVAAVLHAAKRWASADASETKCERLRDAVDALADAYVAFGEAVEQFKAGPDEPSKLAHGRIAK